MSSSKDMNRKHTSISIGIDSPLAIWSHARNEVQPAAKVPVARDLIQSPWYFL